MNWTMITLAAGLTALGLALVLLAIFLKRDTGAPTTTLEQEADRPTEAEARGAFIDQPLRTDMSEVLQAGTAMEPGAEADAQPQPPPGTEADAQPQAPAGAEADAQPQPPAEAEPPEEDVLSVLEWEEAIPASLFESESSFEPEQAGLEVPETIDVVVAAEAEAPLTGRALVPRPAETSDYSWRIRRDAPTLGAAAGIAVAASLIGYAVGRRRRKAG